MSDQRWVYSGEDCAAHLLRHGDTRQGVTTARCGNRVRVEIDRATVEHSSAPERACRVCVRMSDMDSIADAVENLLATPPGPLTLGQRDALRDWLASRSPD